ncbi:MAG TPA: MotA/TolQ/ExbB proton channel family protein [Alphaproteobacteria bacterium]|nr:MotA/TolQ/ExbB proton channel family protein [Alphaproteobacteria bacterium]
MASIATTLGEGLRDRSYNKVVHWILVAGLTCLGAVVLYDYGFLSYLYAADSSRISVLITVLFVGFSLYCLGIIFRFSQELSLVTEAAQRLARGEAPRVHDEDIWLGDFRLPRPRLVTEHLLDLMLKRQRDAEAQPGVLLDSFISQFRSRTRFGTYASDVLYKLGMLGTVIGFIQMLGSLDAIEDFSTETLRASLQTMTGGMATALLTTVAGLVCGLILRVQFNMADAVAADVVKRTVRIGDIYLAPTAKTAPDVRA